MHVQALVAQATVEGLDEGVLHGFAWADEIELHAAPIRPVLRAALRGVLERHNPIEEGQDGVYAACEGWQETTAPALLASLRAIPEVSVNPHVDSDVVEGATRRALVRAGYAFEDFEV